MLKDRGTIKWTSLMLPEHVEMLKEVFKEEDYKEKPILDEHQKWEIDAKLQSALNDDLTLKIKYHENHNEHYVEGKLLNIDMIHGIVYLDDDYFTKVDFNNLIDVTIL